jgi:hypothetical protein
LRFTGNKFHHPKKKGIYYRSKESFLCNVITNYE